MQDGDIERKAKLSRIGKSNVSTSKVHERRVAKLLSEWSGVPFRRRRVEGRDGAVRIVELVADVIPCVGDFHFSIECKKGKSFSLDALMANPHGSLFTSWWHQACYDAQLLSGDLKRRIYPMMFFKPHPNWDWVAVSAATFQFLLPAADTPTLVLPHLYFGAFDWVGPVSGNVLHSKKNKKLVELQLDPVVMCRWRDFASAVRPESAFLNFPDDAAITSVSRIQED